MPAKKKTPAQQEAARKADAKRYAKDPAKRIAAEKAYKAKQKAKNPAGVKQKTKARNEAPKNLPPTSAKCPHCGRTGGRKEWHHISYNPPKGELRCSLCNPRGASA